METRHYALNPARRTLRAWYHGLGTPLVSKMSPFNYPKSHGLSGDLIMRQNEQEHEGAWLAGTTHRLRQRGDGIILKIIE